MLDGEIQALIDERQEARHRRDFARGDEIRDELAERGIILEDTKDGVRWKTKEIRLSNLSVYEVVNVWWLSQIRQDYRVTPKPFRRPLPAAGIPLKPDAFSYPLSAAKSLSSSICLHGPGAGDSVRHRRLSLHRRLVTARQSVRDGPDTDDGRLWRRAAGQRCRAGRLRSWSCCLAQAGLRWLSRP